MKKLLIFSLTFVLLFSVSISAFAEGEFTTINGIEVPIRYMQDDTLHNVSNINTGTLILLYARTSGNLYLRWLEESDVLYDGSTLRAENETYLSHYKFTASKEEEPYFTFTNKELVTFDNANLMGAGLSLLWSSDDIYSTDGSLYFSGSVFPLPPVPMWETTQEQTAEIVRGETLPAVVGAMKILTVCGVGCLTLLMVLNLFGKALRIFLLK